MGGRRPNAGWRVAVEQGLSKGGSTPRTNKMGQMAYWQFFFDGLEYVFNSNDYVNVGYVKNNMCTAKGIVLHRDEPEDDLTKPYRLLKHLPEALLVKPHGIMPVGDICGDVRLRPRAHLTTNGNNRLAYVAKGYKSYTHQEWNCNESHGE